MFSIPVLSHHAPGARSWLYLHLCVWVIHRSLVLRLPWRTWVCLSEDQARSWHSSLGHGDPSSIRYTEEPVATGSGDTALSSVQSLSHVRLFVTPWTAACQASLSITDSQSPPKPMSIEWVMPSSHLILCRPLLLLPSIFPSIRVFSNESVLLIRWPKCWSLSFIISASNEHPGLISFRMDCLDLLAVQETIKSLLQHHSSEASIPCRSAFFIVQFSYPYMTTGKTIALTRWEAEHQRIDVFQLWC